MLAVVRGFASLRPEQHAEDKASLRTDVGFEDCYAVDHT